MHEEVVGDFNQGCFSTVFLAETRLKGFMEVVCVKTGLKLCGNHPLKGLGNEGLERVGD